MRTVFILGAGASHPFGFPLGYGLVDDILKVLDSKRTDFHNWGVEERKIETFKQAIRKSRPLSIDDLIIQRPKEFLEIGKLAIAHALVQYENPDKLINRDNNEHWYSFFCEHVRKLSRPISQYEYSFITFNYDRSLEHYLFEWSEEFYGTTDLERKKAIRFIPILHVHGHLGMLPSYGGIFPYSPTDDRSQIVQIARNLRLVDEEADKGVIDLARTLLQYSDKIRFLGFGYHENNLAKLDFDVSAAKCHDIAGTAIGKTAPEIRKIHNRHKINLDTRDRTIVKFFREANPLD